MVAARVFKRLAEEVLPYLDVPRDVPVGPRLIQASYKNREISDRAALEDFTPTDFFGLPDQPPAESAATNLKEGGSQAPSVTVAVDEGGDVQVPDLSVKTILELTETYLRLGLDPILIVTNLSTNTPPA